MVIHFSYSFVKFKRSNSKITTLYHIHTHTPTHFLRNEQIDWTEKKKNPPVIYSDMKFNQKNR